MAVAPTFGNRYRSCVTPLFHLNDLYMKPFPFFLLLSLLALIACNKEDDTPEPSPGNCIVQYTYNGVETTDVVIACTYLDGTLNVGATGVDDSQIQIDPITAPGTFSSLNNDPMVFVAIKLDDGTQVFGVDVTVKVEKLTATESSGTFSGEFADFAGGMYTITGGKFEAAY